MKLTLMSAEKIAKPESTAGASLADPRGCWKGNMALALVLLAAPAGAAPASSPPGPWRVGPVPEVRAVCHTGNLLWVGTSAGLFTVDVRNGALVDHIVAGPRLPSSSVRALAALGDSIFVGTDTGLACLVGDASTIWTPHAPGKLGPVPLARIHDVSFGANGDWLISSGGGGLGIVTRGRGFSFTRRDSLLADDVFGVLERPNGVRWIATAAGLCSRVNDTTLVSFQAGAGIPRGEVRRIVGNQRAAYLLVTGRGVFRFDGAHASALPSPRDVPLREASSLSYGPDGSLWAAGMGWAAVLRGGKWSRVSVPSHDAQESWRVVTADGAGAFLGSSRGVVLATGRGGALRVELPGSLPSPRVDCIRADGSGGAWLVSGGSAVHAQPATQEVRVDPYPLAAQSLAVLRSGTVIAAGRWTVRRLAGATWEDLSPDIPESDPAFTMVASWGRDELWIGTRAGSLYRYDGEVWLRVARADDRIGDGALLDAFVSSPGDVWARIQGKTAVLRSGYWYRPAGIDSTTEVVDMAASASGQWIAVTPDALFRMDETRRCWVATTPGEIVGGKRRRDTTRGRLTAATFDGSGHLFLGSTEGVARIGRDGVEWLGSERGVTESEVSDLAADDHYLWIGFAQEGLSVVALEQAR